MRYQDLEKEFIEMLGGKENYDKFVDECKYNLYCLIRFKPYEYPFSTNNDNALDFSRFCVPTFQQLSGITVIKGE